MFTFHVEFKNTIFQILYVVKIVVQAIVHIFTFP